MLLSTAQISRIHGLDGHSINLCATVKDLERISTNFANLLRKSRKPQPENRDKLHDLKLLRNLSVLEKMKYLEPYNVKKYLEECLILSKIDYIMTLSVNRR